MARKYTKRSEYWEKFKNRSQPLSDIIKSESSEVEPELIGEGIYQSVQASRLDTPTGRTASRTNRIATNPIAKKYSNIDEGILPLQYSKNSVDAREAILLCQKAYFNIATFRSTIDLLSEFADSQIYVEGGTDKSRKFVNAWFKRIRMFDLKAQYFREYYRSGNVFLYRIDGLIPLKNSQKVLEAYGASVRKKIPIKYMVINPTDVATKGSLSFSDYQYFKVLTPFEISRLKNPQTEHEIELLNSLPEEVQVQLKSGPISAASENIQMELNPDFLHVIFAKKQDYEPMAIPTGFAVLDDLNRKIELKKIDQAISRSIENVVLLVTMGNEPDKGGVNHKNLAAMQTIFRNQSVGRVLVSDYTTKANFIIPDINKVVGPEKYATLNRDIEEGLQNILIGDSKYADGKIKMKVFFQRLEEARNLFVNEFLNPEIRRVCKAAGLRAWPEVKFVKNDTLDDENLTKLAIRLMELGVLTPEQGMKVVHTGTFPNPKDMDSAQDKFKDEREKGHYLPLVNSINLYDSEEEAPQEKPPQKGGGDPEPKDAQKIISPSGGRPVGVSNSNTFSKKNIVEATKMVDEFELRALRDFALKYGLDELDEEKGELVTRVCESIILAKEADDWDSTLAQVVENLDALTDLDISKKVLEVGANHQLDDLSSAILYHSTKIQV
tara:strand:+ start:308 stop:2305 length:1998 start_codon:yes stop_codon:yes gene_type:complete